MPEAELHEGISRLATATKRGGWMTLGHGKFGDDAVENALNSFRTVSFGGTPLGDAAAQALHQSASATRVTTLPTPPGAPALTVCRIPT